MRQRVGGKTMQGMMLALSLLAAEGTAKTASPAAASMTVQARFDAANQAAAEQRCTEAVAQYEAIERVPAIQRNALARASIALRKGVCLIDLGRHVEGEASVRQGLPLLEAKGAEFANDVRDGRLALANAARLRFDYDAGIAEAERALALSQGVQRVRPLQTLATLTLFDGDGRALRFTEEARALIAADPAFTKRELATVQTLHARALLNAGRHQEAYAVLKDSLAKQGGLDLKVSFGDIATRSDLAIAALLNGDKGGARKYLAYTGAGRISDAPFARAAVMDAPPCDAAIGLDSGDRAIVEFSLREDGQIGSVQPIYVTGNRQAALAFASAVSRWSWTAEDAGAVPAFYRALTRVELRCTNRGGTPELLMPVRDAAQAWLSPDEAPAWDGMSDAAALPLQRAAFDTAPGPRDRLAAGMALLASPVADDGLVAAALPRVAALAEQTDAPPSIRVQIALAQLNQRHAPERRAAADALKALTRTGLARSVNEPGGMKGHVQRIDRAQRTLEEIGERTMAEMRTGTRALLAEPRFAGDPLVAATLRLMLVPAAKDGMAPDASALLDAVITDTALPARHPLKVHALLRRADLLAASGDIAGAADMVARTGLSAEQCAMLGVTPAMRQNGASPSDFPQAAQQWGFEGWVRTEFDITADGRAVEPRALIAYPPFVFDDAATGIASGSRWTSSYRGDRSVACAASNLQIRFVLPH